MCFQTAMLAKHFRPECHEANWLEIWWCFTFQFTLPSFGTTPKCQKVLNVKNVFFQTDGFLKLPWRVFVWISLTGTQLCSIMFRHISPKNLICGVIFFGTKKVSTYKLTTWISKRFSLTHYGALVFFLRANKTSHPRFLTDKNPHEKKTSRGHLQRRRDTFLHRWTGGGTRSISCRRMEIWLGKIRPTFFAGGVGRNREKCVFFCLVFVLFRERVRISGGVSLAVGKLGMEINTQHLGMPAPRSSRKWWTARSKISSKTPEMCIKPGLVPDFVCTTGRSRILVWIICEFKNRSFISVAFFMRFLLHVEFPEAQKVTKHARGNRLHPHQSALHPSGYQARQHCIWYWWCADKFGFWWWWCLEGVNVKLWWWLLSLVVGVVV